MVLSLSVLPIRLAGGLQLVARLRLSPGNLLLPHTHTFVGVVSWLVDWKEAQRYSR